MTNPKHENPLQKSKDLAQSIRNSKRASAINQRRGMKDKVPLSVTRSKAKGGGAKTPTETNDSFDTKPLMHSLNNLGFYGKE